jgi:hypothetical protein
MINWLVRTLSGEWMLDGRPNGGTVIFLRALWVSSLVFLASVLVSVLWVCPESSCQLVAQLRHSAKSNFLPFAAGTFAFAYTALYARFASQWSYLANLYNQIMAVKVGMERDQASGGSGQTSMTPEALQKWQAGFIEDAEDLHLATKPMFAGVVLSMLAVDGVRDWFIKGAPGGERRLRILEARARLAFESAVRRH